ILAGTNLWTLKAWNDARTQLHSEKATTDTLRSRLEVASEDIRQLRDQVRTLDARVGERAERESDEQNRRTVVADATRLEQGGQALLRRCCMEAGYAAVAIPHPLDSTITVWRRGVRAFVRRTSNPAFESVSYSDQVDPPESRTRCEAVMFGAVNRP